MKLLRRSIAFLAAFAMLSANAASAVPAAAAESYDLTVKVDLSGEGKPISPYIFGINEYGHQDDLKTVRARAVRQGGNRMTGYNWENNASNAGSDWKYSSDNNLSASDAPADCARQLSKEAARCGIDYKMTTLQLAGYVAADKNGTVTEAETAPSMRWNEVRMTKDGAFAEEPDLTDGVVYMDEYVNYIIGKLGDSQSETGIQGYSLDNEPALWSSTHSRIHPEPVSIRELSEKSAAAAAAVKKLDPKAEIFGPALYGYTAFDHLADTDSSDEWETCKAAGGYHWYLDCYLEQMKQASEKAGTRLLDVLDIHYYSESCRNGTADRLQSVRTLYEKGFSENSWIGQWCMENVPILPTVQKSIDTYYPGTKLAVTEYNFGGDDEPSGAIAQAEALGCYADANVYFASLWGGSGYILSGLKLYTNYDGKGGCFGDTLMPASTEDVSKSSAYAAQNKDASLVTVMVTNKELKTAAHTVITLGGAQKAYRKAAVYAVTEASPDIRLLEITDVKDGKVTVDLPAYCASMIVISDQADAFAFAAEEEKTEKSAVYDDPMHMINENDFVEIPITDPEHLKKIVITGDVSSSGGSSWGSAGCAVGINAVTPDGTKFWTSKGYSLNLGHSSTTVTFDGTLQNEDKEDVAAVVADSKIELQQWWSASEKQEADLPDEITVNYTKIEVIYEYSADESQSSSAPGDVNADGRTDAADAAVLQKYLLTAGTLRDGKAADLDGNGIINAADLTLLKRSLLK